MNWDLDTYQQKLSIYESAKLKLEEKLRDQKTVQDHKIYKSVSIDYDEIKPKYNSALQIVQLLNQFKQTQNLVSESENSKDADMLELAKSELSQLEHQIDSNIAKLKQLEIEVDPMDKGNAIIELRAGTGGDEAALFTQDMYRAYTKYAESLGLTIEIADVSYANGAGGFKEIIFFIEGQNAFKYFKYENGVHRVQRIPETESSGRIHTSAISAVVLPESEDVEIEIKDEDLRIDVYRSSGPGGQSVNTTDSAVRIVHNPSGIIVTCQDEKSQHKNKAKAMKILKAKLYDQARAEQEAEQAALRKSAIKSGDRSAKIRTYNYPQSRITDHRIKQSWHNLEEVMNGVFDDIVTALETAAIEEQLNATDKIPN